ncbi:MAG: ATP-binding cassette domain-containing protein, partial [Desulfomonile tiedjei]|nr:ATP-binding cassette domain-containing protein [Desulfomonile tiedjei]
EMVFVVGRNGAGKTTLLRTISGFLTPGKGSIRLDGNSIAGIPAEQLALRGIRYVFQDKRVFTQLTVRENIQLAAFPTGEPLDEAIDKVTNIYPKISQFLDSKAGGLSGGQRQLLLLGRALIGNPRLLLIDEPTEGLAAGIIEEVFRILEMMKGQLSLVIVEQNLAAVSRLADRVYAMKEGEIATELGKSDDIQQHGFLEQYL